ncbi:HpcH/HpaI aldolase/citrate lyase family protein [Methylobacterium sp. J-067]|uniref:HpcH/HpaI aldolase/citrate lyase family protein n=1 Tax=Methylobacterium sp. J-067 TaxID=2836648 RepID=UPI001FBB80FB|nr:CoA ester lyase [Methylobacterium sp. J-067]MCJ2026318.1 CoA ester lyase [Methylobacterium sp. J-067]
MRSKLFVPASRPDLFAKAAAGPADALSFDLEDAVPEARKGEARETLAAYLREAPSGSGQIVVVRVNAPGTAHFAADLEAVALPRTDLVNLPMVEEPAAITDAAARLDRLDPEGRIRLLVNIETPRSLRRAADLACAHPRVAGLQIGYADLLEPCGIDRDDAPALAQIRVAVRLAAAEARVPAYDGAFAAVKEPEAFRAECEAARRHGFAGKTCIHPSQVGIANAAFLPRPDEVEWSRRILAAAAEAETRGLGAILVDGRMIDPPFLARARAVVALSDLHAGTQAR